MSRARGLPANASPSGANVISRVESTARLKVRTSLELQYYSSSKHLRWHFITTTPEPTWLYFLISFTCTTYKFERIVHCFHSLISGTAGYVWNASISETCYRNNKTAYKKNSQTIQSHFKLRLYCHIRHEFHTSREEHVLGVSLAVTNQRKSLNVMKFYFS